MRLLPCLLLFCLFPLLAVAQTETDITSALINGLRDKDVSVRKSSAIILSKYKIPEAVEALVLAVQDEKNTEVSAEMYNALELATGEKMEREPTKWKAWFDEKGGRFEKTISLSARRVLSDYQKFLTISIVFNILAFAGVFGAILYFVGSASNRNKALKELMRQAEQLVAEGNEVQKKSGGILDGLDAKKGEIMMFFSKLKDENESEIERYGDMIEQNIEHRMREVTMQLREKAERELETTFKEEKAEIDGRIKRVGDEQKELLLKELTNRQQRFIADVEAHTLFLEASFFYISGKLQDAVRIYRKLLVLKPDHYIAWSNYGTLMRDLLRFDESEEAYGKALALSPDNPSVLYQFATVYAMQKKKEKMLEALKRSIQFDAEFKDEALNEKAFKEYWEDAEFKDIAEG